MNRYRQRHPDHDKAVKKAPTTYGELTGDADDAKAAEDIYAVAAVVWAVAGVHRLWTSRRQSEKPEKIPSTVAP